MQKKKVIRLFLYSDMQMNKLANSEKKNSFAVLMAVYKNDDHILFQRAVKSVLHNSSKPKNFIIVCDGPLTPELEYVLASDCVDERVNLVRLPMNMGLFSALNIGLNSITEEFVIRADADDFNHPDRFEIILDQLSKGYDLVGSWIKEFDKNGNPIALRKTVLTQNEIVKFIRKRNPFNHMSVGFRTSIVKSVGGYPAIYLREDYGLWIKILACGGKVCNVDKVLVDATAGNEMFRRRGGFRYAMGEFDLQNFLIAYGYSDCLHAFFYGFIRVTVFLAPNFVRRLVYLHGLRGSG